MWQQKKIIDVTDKNHKKSEISLCRIAVAQSKSLKKPSQFCLAEVCRNFKLLFSK